MWGRAITVYGLILAVREWFWWLLFITPIGSFSCGGRYEASGSTRCRGRGNGSMTSASGVADSMRALVTFFRYQRRRSASRLAACGKKKPRRSGAFQWSG